jgi:quercetin dioxygenase-like cupin family protein
MNTKIGKLIVALMLILVSMSASSWAMAGVKDKPAPLVIQEQGSFAVGGTVVTNPGTFDPIKMSPEGQTFHGDHAYVSYQIPVNARKLPLVLWHGFGQFSKTWETTQDGREGFQNIFLRRGFGVYLVDQPRRGNAGRSTKPNNLTPVADEQKWFNNFRLGVWPNFFPGVQFSRDPEAMNQYFRQMTPDTGPIDIEVNSDAVAALFKKIGPGILVTHSHSGGMGWLTAIKSLNVRAVVAYEPGSNFVFPEGEVPAPKLSSGGTLEGVGIPLADFMKLTKIPIIIYYGDNIPAKPSENPGQDMWRVRLEMARHWAATVNRHGGDVTVVHLPETGIRGNTHFPFSDLNNLDIADLMYKFLENKVLSSRQAEQRISITRSGSQPSSQGSADYFTGSVTINMLFTAHEPSRTTGGLVTFQPGARTAWHSHPLGQTLLVTAGTGRRQQWGGPIEEIRQGDVVRIPPGQKHWHGAAPNSAMTHIAIQESLEGKTADWKEQVSDEQYPGNR